MATVSSQEGRLSDLERAVSEIKRILPAAIHNSSNEPSATTATPGLVTLANLIGIDNEVDLTKLTTTPDFHSPDLQISELIAQTQNLFPGKSRIEVTSNPDEVGTLFAIITVFAKGETEELLRRRVEWHRRVRQLCPENASYWRLSILPQ